MRWEKLGQVYAPDGTLSWAQTHAYLPTPIMLDESRIRVYVAFLDADRVGRLGWVDVAAADPTRVLDVSQRPALDIGRAGTFDDNGVSPTSVSAEDGRIRLYYMGWQLGVRVPYFIFSGVAESRDGGETFERWSEAPVLDRTDGEAVCRSAPSVLHEAERWRAWYVAADAWIDVDGHAVPTYCIKTIASQDGLQFAGPGADAVVLADSDEFGLGRPYVVRERDGYRMFYSVRSRTAGYRIGTATSADGDEWTRSDDEIGIGVSAEGWDSEMICFAAPLETPEGTIMFYNGNGYGRTGFGVAALSR
jgi:hypothetical protein